MSEIVIAPFSNNALRDWPAENYGKAIELLLPQLGPEVRFSVIGTRGQRLAAAQIVRPFTAERVVNDCGLPWGAVLDKIRKAGCVIGNNSGITHTSCYLGAPTVCIFGGSHQRTEWGPLGENAIILSRVIGCSPCQLNSAADCPYGAACLREIEPREVGSAALRIMAHTPHKFAARRLDRETLDEGMPL
ncbi:glycosyltransferase family 9 protein [Sphingomonas sp. ASY06-1R]|uniref:glycosyltransferase family 9 protein n=1 Tax=Sphingomonas sp. ASY06-1R TaxID=3445771 RepID=UPI003FA30996